MSGFAFLFRGREPAGSPEEMQKQMENWIAWMKALGADGRIKDPGNPLERTGKVVSGWQRLVNDGPYAEAKDLVGGYIVIEAGDLAEAAEIAKGCPIFEAGGFVEVRPIRTMNL
jgi:hypothetical protein